MAQGPGGGAEGAPPPEVRTDTMSEVPCRGGWAHPPPGVEHVHHVIVLVSSRRHRRLVSVEVAMAGRSEMGGWGGVGWGGCDGRSASKAEHGGVGDEVAVDNDDAAASEDPRGADLP